MTSHSTSRTGYTLGIITELSHCQWIVLAKNHQKNVSRHYPGQITDYNAWEQLCWESETPATSWDIFKHSTGLYSLLCSSVTYWDVKSHRYAISVVLWKAHVYVSCRTKTGSMHLILAGAQHSVVSWVNTCQSWWVMAAAEVYLWFWLCDWVVLLMEVRTKPWESAFACLHPLLMIIHFRALGDTKATSSQPKGHF